MDERKLSYPGSLHNHLDWSNERLRDCIIKTEDLINYAIELGHQVVAITDHETVSGAVRAEKYYQKIKEKNPDFKLILGNEIYLCRNGLNASNYKAGQDKYYHFILLAKDAIGHQQIRELSTRAWLRSYMARGMRRVPTYYNDLFEIIGANPGHVIGSTACFRAGTQIETRQGWKNIEDIQSGDLVINRYGEWEKVIEPTSRNYIGDGYEIILGGNPSPIYCTGNHQFLVISNNKKTPRWVSAEELITKKGGTKHMCLLPCSYDYKSSPFIEKTEFLHSWSSSELSYKKYILPDRIEITPELMRLFGLFLGDGCITLKKNPNIKFTFNEKEFPIYYNSFILPASQQLGIEWSVSARPDNHRVDISCSSREFIDLFFYLFGDVKADTKKVPERLRISEELDYELVFGYFLADGYFRIRKPGNLVKYACGEFVSASISKQLSYDIYEILNQLHITSGISLAKVRTGKDGVHHQNAWYVEGSNSILGVIKKLQAYSHQEVCQIFSQAKTIKQTDYIFIDNTWYRKVRIKSKTKITMNEIVYCLNNTTHSFKCENVIVHNCLGGCLPTQLLHAKVEPELLPKIYNWISQLDNLFGHGNFFFEMQPSHNKDQIYVNQQLLELSEELDIPYIITTDSHYLKKEDRAIHRAYLNAQNGDREVDDFYASTYMMNTKELESYFGYFSREQLEKAYRNILQIREVCEDYSLLKPLKIPELEWYEYPKNEDEYLFYREKIPLLETFYNSSYIGDRQLVWAVIDGIKTRRGLQTDEAYKEINVCLDDTWRSSIKNNAHWSAYYLNLQKNIDLCWEAGSLVGPGRGSGAGFVLLYVLGITQINPLLEETKVFHWRFLNPDRASVVDCDTDIEGSKRAQVLQKFRDFYGEDRVSNVATFKTEKSKSAILSACLKPGTVVNTIFGLKEIEKISTEDMVNTTEGLQRVLVPTHRQYNGELYTFDTAGIGLPFSVTHNHRLLVYTNRKKKEKNKCQNYKECQLIDNYGNVLGTFTSIKQASQYYADKYNGSFNSMYKYKAVNGYSIIECPIIQNHQVQWLTAEDIHETDFLLSPIYGQKKDTEDYIFFPYEEQNPYHKSVIYIKDKVRLDEEFCELIGIYLAEGNINHKLHGITFTIHQEENWLKERIIYLLKNVFGIEKKNLCILPKQESHGLSIQVNSTPLGRFFNRYFPGKCDKKTVGIIKNLPAKVQLYTLYGCYYGDGYGRQRKNYSYEGKITSVSYQLITDLWQIAANNGYNCPVITEDNRSSQKKIVYNLMFYGKTAKCLYNSKYLHSLDLGWEYQKPIEYDGKKYYPIKIKNITKEQYKGEVFCLETSAHNYLLNNIVSHNCRGLNIEVDIASYLAGLIPADRGQLRTLSQCMNGDEEKDFKPIRQFVYEMTENYPEVWAVASKIEGLICGVGIHAGGVIFVDEPFTNSTALMRAPDGTIITAFELHDCEDVSLIKIDMLSIEALDKIHNELDLLVEYGYIKPEATLRETYEKAIGIYNLERTAPEMWQMVWEHKITSLFQMEKQSGINGIALTHPKSVSELAVLNSVIRLMAPEKGAEQPLDMWARYRSNIVEWEREMRVYGLSQANIDWLMSHNAITDGICESQEGMMQLLQEERLGGNNLTFADKCRKAISKKQGKLFDECEKAYFENAQEKNCDMKLVHYVWDVLLRVQRGYSFN